MKKVKSGGLTLGFFKRKKDNKNRKEKLKKEGKDLTRNSNLELLRIVSMFLIICFHVIIHGRVLINSQNNTLSVIVYTIELITLVHVNSFALVTGYFQSESKFRMSKVWSLLNSSLFYKATIMFFLVFLGYITVSKVDILRNLSLFPVDSHWFIRVFIPLYIFSPFINKLIKNLSQKDYLKLLGALFIVMSVIPFVLGDASFPNSGLSLYQLVYCYLIGGYLKKYPIEKSYIFKRCSKQLFQIILVGIFIFCVLLNLCLYTTVYSLKDVNNLFGEIFRILNGSIIFYSSPIVMIQSVAYFLFFSTLNIKSKVINFISSLTFGIYLIHENYLLFPILYPSLGIDNGPIYRTRFVFYIILIAFLIFVVCAFIEFCRQILFRFIKTRKISIKLRNKFNSFVGNIKILKLQENNS